MNGVVTLRPATIADADLLLGWANDAAVRRASFSSEPIEREGHVAWLSAKLADDGTAFFIAESGGRPVGYSRLERRSDHVAEIAVSVDAEARGQGIGRRIISLASAVGGSSLGTQRVTARVKNDNEPSLRAFRAAGFTDAGAEDGDMMLLVLESMSPVPHSRPYVGETEANAAAAVVRSGRLAQGPVVADVEARWCELTGMVAAACVGSGVGALRLALLALGVGPGDEVIVPAYSCVALLNAPLALGAEPVLADVGLDRWTLDVEDVAARVTPKTRAIVAVDLFGMPSSVSELSALGPSVCEDCAHGIGGHSNAGPFGGGGAVSIGSFYATKMIGAGEGGIVAAHDAALIEQVRHARDYGDRLPNRHHLNDKLSDVEAAIVREQLLKLDEILERRSERAAAYTERLRPGAEAGLFTLPADDPGRIWYRYAVRLTDRPAPEVCERAARLGVHLEQPVWDLRDAAQWGSGLRNTETAFDRVVSLPLYPDLRPAELDTVVDTLMQVLREG